MKQKNALMSKPFIIGVLVVLCVGILIACLIWGKSDKPEFAPDPPQSSNPIESWTQNPSPMDGGTYQPGGQPTTETPQYPIITSEDGLCILHSRPVKQLGKHKFAGAVYGCKQVQLSFLAPQLLSLNHYTMGLYS